MSPLLPGSWVLAPAMLAIGAVAVAIVAGVLLARRRARLAARTLVYGVTVLSMLATLTSGGLHAYVALPWLAVLIVAGLMFRLRESVPVCLVAVLTTFFIEIWRAVVNPLPTLWAIREPPLGMTFSITALLAVVLLHLSVQQTIERRIAAALANAEKERDRRIMLDQAQELHLMFGGLPVAVALYDADAILRYANDPYLSLLGKTLPECLAQSMTDLWPRRASMLAAPHFATAARGKPGTYSFSFNLPDGTTREFDVFVAPTTPGDDGRFDSLVLMLDRTDSLRMERALAERETMYSAVVDHAPIAILTQVDGLISYANPAALMMLSAEWSGRAVGRPFSEFIIEADRAAVRDRIAMLADAPGFAEFRHHRLVALNSQVRDVELAAISVTRDGKQLVELFCVDVTERRLTEEKVRQLNETLELRVAERTAELEAFTTSVSHDLRAPARQVMSAADIMLRKLEQPDGNVKPMLTALHATAERMNRTIDALLELSRLGRAGIVQSVWPLGVMVEEIRSELSADLHSRNLVWRIEALPRVYADPQLIRMVMVNLIGNALKFTRHKPMSIIEIWSEEFEHMTAVCVRDNGAGFDMNNVDKLFQMFTRLHSNRDFEGTGVGLAHCRRIIERHGGKISAYGEPGQGATVRFTLPRETRRELPSRAQT
ncbi:hypothetical protein GCM10007242_19370 [Pigmentiphaga litoralis]|uniref:PAS domain-containing sensor histidine kinase n=1 Tax=Pigmentiphaga litoralis TaxID=516702 RepID=UPI00167C0ACE|nr:PAS domain-containing sensor histidine kinase [Pigmentiphaga litoralis]GGX13145.1 hypothetical protein GCM10007242_19370 [Pigmentiphaga litoralis]